MALLVWLPLNGSMENQGLLDLTPTQQGTISWIDGKIGKCLSAGNANQTANGISYNSNLVAELGTEFSAAVWVKPLGNHVHYNGTFVSSGNWNTKKWTFGVSQNNSQVDVFCQGYNTYITCEVPVNTWTHLCCVHQGTSVKLYKNGEYVGEKTNIPGELDSDATNFCIGRETYASGYFSFNGNLNDLRIYNHALSLKEIKELAKGLVLHYKLDDLAEEYDNIIFDSSGYNYNGEIIGNLTSNSNTPKYSLSTYFDSSEPNTNSSTGLSYIKADFGLTEPIEMSVCWWAKPENGYGNTTSHAAWCTSSSSAPTDYNSTAFHHRDGWFDICLNSESTTSIHLAMKYTKNEWHYYCVTYDGKIAKLYKDGVFSNQVTVSSTEAPLKTFSNLFIGYSRAGGVWRKTLGSYSDFRVYATALSEEDIAELYHTAASIDKQGNLFCGEVVE